VSGVERIAQTYSHTLRSDLIAELNLLRARDRSLRAALDEANTDRQRLQADFERVGEAWSEVVQREQRSDNAHDYDMDALQSRLDIAVALGDQLSKDFDEARAERDRAVAQLCEQRKHASAVMAAIEQYGPGIVGHLLDTDDNAGEFLRRALAGEGSDDGA
jgi:chromosome segregation ATPase